MFFPTPKTAIRVMHALWYLVPLAGARHGMRRAVAPRAVRRCSDTIIRVGIIMAILAARSCPRRARAALPRAVLPSRAKAR